MERKRGWIIFWASILLLVATPLLGQQRRISCEEARDIARTRITVVSNSRVLMEEDLATMSVRLGYARQRIERMDAELKSLKEKLKLAEGKATEDETETKEPKAETKTSEAETRSDESETEEPKGETVGEEPTQ